MLWEPNTVYELDGTGKIQFFDIDVSILYDRFKDGRISGLLVENVIDMTFDNIHKVESEKSNFDAVDEVTGKNIEIRTVTKRGVQLIPSNMIGAGRHYDHDKYMEKLNTIGFYIFVDIRQLPIMKIFSIDSSYPTQCGVDNPIKKLSNNQIDELISESTPITI